MVEVEEGRGVGRVKERARDEGRRGEGRWDEMSV